MRCVLGGPRRARQAAVLPLPCRRARNMEDPHAEKVPQRGEGPRQVPSTTQGEITDPGTDHYNSY